MRYSKGKNPFCWKNQVLFQNNNFAVFYTAVSLPLSFLDDPANPETTQLSTPIIKKKIKSKKSLENNSEESEGPPQP